MGQYFYMKASTILLNPDPGIFMLLSKAEGGTDTSDHCSTESDLHSQPELESRERSTAWISLNSLYPVPDQLKLGEH